MTKSEKISKSALAAMNMHSVNCRCATCIESIDGIEREHNLGERLALIEHRPLLTGCHKSIDEGMCVMEAVAYVAGEPWSDSPACSSPTIAAFLRNWNDSLSSDADRSRLLRPLIFRLIDTKGTPETELRRSFLAFDWLVRVFTPKWLDLVPALSVHAVNLRQLTEIVDNSGASLAAPFVIAAWDAAWDAARAAAWDAAWDAARAAAWDAAWDAARAAAGAAARAAARAAAWAAAWDAAWDAARAAARAAAGAAAGDAARAAARAAAWDAAWDALNPTVDALQQSALELVERMIQVRP